MDACVHLCFELPVESALTRIDTTAAIETPERIRFRFRVAGPGRRAAAWGIDLVGRVMLFAVLLLPFVLLSTATASELLSGAATGFFLFGLFVLDWAYGIVFETLMGGRTPGKLAMGIRVVRLDGSPGRLQDYVLRNLLRGVDSLPVLPLGLFSLPTFVIGLTVMGCTPGLRRLGDLVAGTIVVIERRSTLLGRVRIEPPVSELERQALPARVELSSDELRVIEAFLRRRPFLSDERAEELAEMYAPDLSERTGVRADRAERVLALAYARSTGRDRP